MPDIPLKSQCFDVAFSPSHDHVYVGLLTGHIKAFAYSDDGEAATNLFSLRPSKQSCRSLATLSDGARLAAASKDKSLRILDTGRGEVVVDKQAAHESAVNRVVSCGNNLLATGDDDGVVKLWDARAPKEIRSYTQHIDYISDLLYTEEKHQLIATSGDCTLTVHDIRSNKAEPLAQSNDQDDELLSLSSLKSHSKLVVGTQLGMLQIFSRHSPSSYIRPVDIFPGHPQSLEALVPITDDVLATGSSDGLIRLVQIMPNKLLGAVADHGEFPVERLAVSRDGRWLASASHDDALKLTDVGDALEESDVDEDEDEKDDDGDSRMNHDSDEDDDADERVESQAATSPSQSRKRQASSSAGGDSDSGRPEVVPVPLNPKVKRKQKKQKGSDEVPGFFDDL